jgi:peptidoglycan/LPS O-acetylase OafA/YrhL
MTSSHRSVVPVPGPTSASPRREAFLDGLRGLAALYVVLHHAFLEVGHLPGGHGGAAAAAVFQLGRLSVAVFIVLSGYCLTASANRSGTLGVGSLPRFLARRAWRILPPYYAALALSLACILVFPKLDHRTGGHWDITLPVTIGSLGAHLLMIHNLSAAWVYKANHALWSVATECQIYVLFPILLLPCVRRLGVMTAVVGTCALGIAAHYALPSLDDARPWYLGLFAIGMATALAAKRSDSPTAGAPRRWGRWTLALIALTLALAAANGRLKHHPWAIDLSTGVAAAALILYCRSLPRPTTGRRPAALAVLESPPAVWLGVVSYSLYLIHPPVLAAIHQWLRTAGGSDLRQFGGMLTLGTAASLLAGAAFFHLVESYFMPGRSAAGRPAPHASPAPVAGGVGIPLPLTMPGVPANG